MSAITQLYDSPRIDSLLSNLDSMLLARELGLAMLGTELPETVAQLRVAARLSLVEILGEQEIDTLLRSLSNNDNRFSEVNRWEIAYRNWDGYLNALLEIDAAITVDELLSYATAGLLARKPTEVRATLRQDSVRRLLDGSQRRRATEWAERLKGDISTALLYLIRQEDHEDVRQAGMIISRLAEDQRRLEAEWLASRDDEFGDATVLLGLYHLAQAVVRLSEFLLTGSVESDGETITDVALELRRLASRAEEYLSISGELDTIFWLNIVTIVLWYLRTDSIWVSGRGISERLDNLLDTLVDVGREKPIFSLLPSQQEALSEFLLDPTKVAVVLQMPTGAGKTLLAEFAIVQAFGAYKRDTRVVYLVPTRALATQVRRTLTEDLRPIGIEVAAAGSAFEEDPYELNLLLATDGVVVATPEKLDLLLRAHPEWFDKLRLVVVDEAHHLQDRERGVRLELLLANIRREKPQARLLLLTPFVDNAREIGNWLGGNRSLSITVRWRPSRLLLGMAHIGGRGSKRELKIDWREPHRSSQGNKETRIPVHVPASEVKTRTQKVSYLAGQFRTLGTVLALYSASRVMAEKAAHSVAETKSPLAASEMSPGLRVAIALARDEFGSNSTLARCLEHGVAYHHSSLSPMLRYLVEDQVRAKKIDFIAATTTLAQGMNFPVATVLIHSVHKPRGRHLLASEFWNIAGRAGRVGLVDKGMVVFADPKEHHSLFEYYSRHLEQSVRSALLAVLGDINLQAPLKEQYREHEELRPFIQYLAHAAAQEGPVRALARLEELLQGSLANVQVDNQHDSAVLRQIARRYLQEIGGQSTGLLKVSDTTGLGSFSFRELLGRLGHDPVLMGGPRRILADRPTGLYHLIDILQELPELSLAIGKGQGPMDVHAVARVVDGWIEGKSIPELANEFPGSDDDDRIRNAAGYVFGKVSQLISWGAHAYLKGWHLRKSDRVPNPTPAEEMLGAYIQYGVNTPEAAVASLLGIPRQFAEPFAAEYRESHGALTPSETPVFKSYVETANVDAWSQVVARSSMRDVNARDVRTVWRQMQGLEPEDDVR